MVTIPIIMLFEYIVTVIISYFLIQGAYREIEDKDSMNHIGSVIVVFLPKFNILTALMVSIYVTAQNEGFVDSIYKSFFRLD